MSPCSRLLVLSEDSRKRTQRHTFTICNASLTTSRLDAPNCILHICHKAEKLSTCSIDTSKALKHFPPTDLCCLPRHAAQGVKYIHGDACDHPFPLTPLFLTLIHPSLQLLSENLLQTIQSSRLSNKSGISIPLFRSQNKGWKQASPHIRMKHQVPRITIPQPGSIASQQTLVKCRSKHESCVVGPHSAQETLSHMPEMPWQVQPEHQSVPSRN